MADVVQGQTSSSEQACAGEGPCAAERCGTQERVLRAAGEVFAEKGFQRATVRQIVRRAGVNLNAVNYHFGDKEGLYRAVLARAHSRIAVDDELAVALDQHADPARRLHAFILGFLRKALDTRHQPHVSRLMALELSEPTSALDEVVTNFIRPRFELLKEIVRAVVGEPFSERALELCAESVVAQCVHLVHAQPIVMRLLPSQQYDAGSIEELAQHVTRFSLAALRHLDPIQGDAS